MSLRQITGQINYVQSGKPWANGRVHFKLLGFGISGMTDADPIYPSTELDVLLDHEGKLDIQLWANENSEKEAIYQCTLPSGEVFRFILPEGSSPIPLPLLAVTYPVPQQPTDLILFVTNRANHYGTQLASTISDFQTAALAALIAPGVPPAIIAPGERGQRIYHEGYVYECFQTGTVTPPVPGVWRRYPAMIF